MFVQFACKKSLYPHIMYKQEKNTMFTEVSQLELFNASAALLIFCLVTAPV